MSDSTSSKSATGTLKQSLLDFRDQMSVYAGHSWPENGLGYGESEPFALREGGPSSSAPGLLGRAPGTGTRQCINAVDQRRHIDREMEVRARGAINAHFEGARNKVPGSPHSSEYNFPPGRTIGVPIENGFRESEVHYGRPAAPQPYIDIDRSRTDPGYLNRPLRPGFRPDVRPYPHGGEGPPYHQYESNGVGNQRSLLPLPQLPGTPRPRLPIHLDDRNQGIRRGYDRYSPSWSPTIDSPDSPNTFPPPQPPPLRRSESPFPRNVGPGGPPLAVESRPPNHPRYMGRAPEAAWMKDAQRRGYMLMRSDERYFGKPDVPVARHANHLSLDRDPRIRRNMQQPPPQALPSSPHSLNPSPAPLSRAKRVEQILSEHAYFNKSSANEAPSTSVGQAQELHQESPTTSLSRSMLTPVPPAISIITKAPMSPTKIKNIMLKNPEVVESLGKLIEMSNLKAEVSAMASEGITPDAAPKILLTIKGPPPFDSSASETEKRTVSEKENDVVPSELSQAPYSDDGGVSSPPSPSLSLSSFDIDLDTEPDSSSDEEMVSGESSISEFPCASGIDRDNLHSLPSIDLTSKKMNIVGRASVAEPVKVGQCNNRILRNGRVHSRTTTYSTRRHPPAIVDRKVPSLTLSLPCESFPKVVKQEDAEESCPPTKMRRSKRLTASTDNHVELTRLLKEGSSASIVLESDSVASKALALSKEEKEERMRNNLARARAIKAERKRSMRMLDKDKPRTTRSGKRRPDHDDEYPAELPPSRRRRKNADFVPEILPSKSRTESETLKRRKEMEIQIEQNERERLETARPEDGVRRRTPSPVMAEPADSSHGDELSSQGSTVSISSRDNDTTTTSKSSLLDEFSPDVAVRCKRISSVRSSSGDTPLHRVCRTGRYDLARYFLLVEKLPINKQDYAGWTPLHEACSSVHPRVAELLLQNGADANISATDGTRPIHDAIEVGSLELVQLLIRYGADPLAEQGEKTPVEFALDMEQPEIHDYLQSVVEDLKAQQSKTTTSTRQPVKTRAVAKAGGKKSSDDDLMIPVDGYTSDDPKFGGELDYPLFYVSPIIELSDVPFLPVYNLTIVPGRNPRRHNFYLLSDVLSTLNLTESELRKKCKNIKAIEFSVVDLKMHCKNSYNFGDYLPPSLKRLANNAKVKLIPVCAQIQSLLGIDIENMDD